MDADLFGYIAATLTTISFFPQALKTLRSRDTHAISLRMYLLFTSGVAFWSIYGWMVGDGAGNELQYMVDAVDELQIWKGSLHQPPQRLHRVLRIN